ncbi:MAG: hypothetical protein H0X72_10065 [Acidobacteria bacterium]|jgi:hypothetical protein|nr:hypothetical protein [Acidobacteriota bacterium]
MEVSSFKLKTWQVYFKVRLLRGGDVKSLYGVCNCLPCGVARVGLNFLFGLGTILMPAFAWSIFFLSSFVSVAAVSAA